MIRGVDRSGHRHVAQASRSKAVALRMMMLRLAAVTYNALPRHSETARDDRPQYYQLEHGASFGPMQCDFG